MNAVVNPHAAVGAGRARKPWRIKEWLDAQGLEYPDVAKRAGLKAASTVCRTIKGQVNNRKVLKALRDMGCPAKYLGLPKDLSDLPGQEEKRVA